MGGSLRRLKKNRPKIRTGLTAKNRSGKKAGQARLKLRGDGNEDEDVHLGSRWNVKATTLANYSSEGVSGDANAAVAKRRRVVSSTDEGDDDGGSDGGDDDGAEKKSGSTHEDGAGDDDDGDEDGDAEWGTRVRTMTQDEINVASGKQRSGGKAPPRRLTVRPCLASYNLIL